MPRSGARPSGLVTSGAHPHHERNQQIGGVMLAQEILEKHNEVEIATSPWFRKELAESVVGLRPVERLVLAHVAGIGAHTSGFKCVHAQETIAREIGVTDRSVRNALKVLEERGLISYELTEIGAEYRDLSKPQPTLSDQRMQALYLDLGQVMLHANTAEGEEFYKFYQEYKQGQEQEKQTKGGHKQEPQSTGQGKPTGEAPGQQEDRPQLKIVEAPPVDVGEQDKPPVVVPAQKPFREMTPEERKAGKALAEAELKLATAQREATTGAEWVPPF